MATRRGGWRGALAGLGVGLTNASDAFLKQYLADRAQDRYDARAQANNLAILERQGMAADRQAVIKALSDAAAGGDPEAAAQILSLISGKQFPVDQIPRPSARRRMEARIGEPIGKATNAEMVPTDEEILSGSKTEGFLGLPDFAVAGMEPESRVEPQDPFTYMGAIPQEFRARAGARRRSWMNKPTEKIERQTPGGATITEFRPPYGGPVETKPDATAQGTIEGTKKVAEIAASGTAVAEQKGRETTATSQAQQDVELSPDAIRKRVDERGRTAYAQKVAEINAQTDNAKKIIDYEYQKAMAMMPVAATEVEFKKWGEQIAEAKEAASTSLPVIGQLRALWYDAQPVLEYYLKRYGTIRAEQAQEWLPRALQDDAVRKYFDFRNAARPRLARAMGNVGNFTELEQEQGGFVVPDVLDAADGGKGGDEKFDRVEKIFMAAPTIAQRQRPGSPPLTAKQMLEILNSWTPAKEDDVPLTPQQKYDILIGPGGITKPGGR